MTVDLGSAQASIGLNYSALESGIAASKTLIGGLGASLLGIGAIGVGLAVATTKMAGDFQSQMTYLVTNAGESEKNIGMVSDGILALATQTGTSTKDLAAGMFMVESANYRGADALKVETAAAEGAKVSHADLTGVTDILTTSLHDYHMQASEAVPVMNSLIAAVGAGKMTMDDLNAALTNVLPVASKAGVSISDVEGALAAMAQAGDRGAGAGTHLSQMFSSLQNPAAKGKAVLAEIGLTTQEVSDKMKTSLPGAIEMMYDALAKKFPVGSAAFNAAAAALVGGNKQMKAWNELTGTSFVDLTSSAKTTADAMKSHSDAVAGWDKVQGDFNTKVDQAKEVVETLGIKIGTALLPVATSLFNLVLPLVSGFDDWITKSGTLSQITGELSGWISNVSGYVSTLTGNANSCGTTFGNAAPLLMDFQTVIGNIKDILPDVGTFLSNVGTDVTTNILPPVQHLVTAVAGAVTNFMSWENHSGAAKQQLQALSGIVATTSQVIGTLVGWTADLVGWLGGGGAGTDTLIGALVIVGGVFATMKIIDFVGKVQTLIGNVKDLATNFLDVASAVKDKAGAAFDFLSGKSKSAASQVSSDSKAMQGDMKAVGTSAEGAGTSVEAVGTDAKTASGEVATASASEEGSLGGVEAQANATGTSIDGIGTDATVASTEVEAASIQEEASLGTVATTAEATGTAELSIGTDATAAAGVAKGAFAGITASMGFLGGLLSLLNINTTNWTHPGTNSKYNEFAGGTPAAPPGWAIVGEQGPELMNLHGGEMILPTGTVPSSSPSGNGGSSSGGSYGAAPVIHLHNHVVIDGRELSEYIAPRIVQSMRVRTGTRN
jgi:TP901 family phage tail tape measure protein